MSIILKGIDLPTEDQVIVIHSDGTFNEVDPFARRLMPFYEAIQIPKDHGRLIEEHYPGELKAKYPDGVFIMYYSAFKDTDRFKFEAEAER